MKRAGKITMQTIENIRVDELYQHPDNPRRDLGDLEELADSIKENGIMQNLTVIKGHYNNIAWVDDGYTVLIGHRRLAAAKMAGLEKVPCAEIEADRKEQVAIMLAENMQREDLTASEQAFGFQMMFDFGCSAEDISQRTGFSKSTVYHRLNMAKLDKETLDTQTAELQLSIKDLEALEQIKDIEKRNEILKEATNSSNLHYLIKEAVNDEKVQRLKEILFKRAEDEGIRPAPEEYITNPFGSKYKDVFSVYLKPLSEEDVENLKFDYDGKTPEQLYYAERFGTFRLIAKREKEKEEKHELTPKEIWDRKRCEKLKNLFENVKAKVMEMLKDQIEEKRFVVEEGELKEAAEFFFSNLQTTNNGITYISGKSPWNLSADEREEYEEELKEYSLESRIYMHAYEVVKGNWTGQLFGSGYYDEENAMKEMKIIDYLRRFGLSLNKEELEMFLGTSYLFGKEDPDE